MRGGLYLENFGHQNGAGLTSLNEHGHSGSSCKPPNYSINSSLLKTPGRSTNICPYSRGGHKDIFSTNASFLLHNSYRSSDIERSSKESQLFLVSMDMSNRVQDLKIRVPGLPRTLPSGGKGGSAPPPPP